MIGWNRNTQLWSKSEVAEDPSFESGAYHPQET